MRFNAWQIEITNRCNLRCRMCTRADVGEAPGDRGAPETRDMSLKELKNVTPRLREAEHVVLEGWGESTLHPSLVEMVRLVRAAGPQVGFVTNGKKLDRRLISGLLDEGLDFIGFSLAGGTDATHRAIRAGPSVRGSSPGRAGSDLEKICESVRIINNLKKESKSDRPHVRFVFLLLKDNIREAPAIVRLAADLGVKRVAFIHITHIVNRWQDGQRAFLYEGEEAGGEARVKDESEADAETFRETILRDARKLAKTLKVELSVPDLRAHEIAVCEENPLRNLYVSSSGDVSPCVFLAPPLASPFKRIFRGEETLVHAARFGNVFREPFERIWESEEYRAFRERFQLRKRAMDELYESLLRRTPTTGKPILPPPPAPCASCHKLFGL
jgi:MoaA/NifB/PqqE/SkfB family radical SAM enzyme